MRPSVSALVAVLFSLVVGLSVLGAVAQQPPPPMIFSGPVFVQGQPAPVGVSLLACVLDCATGWESEAVETRAAPDKPEEPVWYTGVIVGPPAELLSGPITFWIVTDFGRIRATQSSVYKPDFNNLTPILRLDFADPVPLAPTPTAPPTPTAVPTPSPTAISPLPGDASVPGLSRLVLIVGAAALLVGGAILFVIRRRKAF